MLIWSMQNFSLNGHAGKLRAKRWDVQNPRYVVLLCHGYGEHIDRYDELAARLNADGAQVYGLDHMGHGESEGERVLIDDFDAVVRDLHQLAELAHQEYRDVPQVLIGHSMGGMISARYIQNYGKELKCAVLSGPLLDGKGLVDVLLGLPEIPNTPLDPAALSRDLSVGEKYASDPLVWHGPFKRPMLEAMQKSLDAIQANGAFQIPVLHLHGEADSIVNYPVTVAAWEKLKGAQGYSRSYPEARHEIFLETNRQEVFSDLIKWVNQQL